MPPSRSRSLLRRNPDFRRLWTAHTTSRLGTELGALSFTALVFLEASPAQMGLLAAASGVPSLVAGLAAGVFVDRRRRRSLLIAADAGRALMLGVLVAAAVTARLEIVHLYAVALGSGLLSLVFELASGAYLPSVVDRSDLVEGNSKLSITGSAAEVGGNAVGGLIVQALGAPVLLAADAGSYVASGALLASIRVREPAPEVEPGRPRPWREAREGISAVRADPILWTLLQTTSIFALSGGFYGGLYGFFVVRTLGLSPFVLGLLVAAGGASGIVGAATSSRMIGRLGIGRALLVSRLTVAAFSALILVAGGPDWLAITILGASQLLGDAFWVTADIANTTIRQTLAPSALLGRVNATMHVAGAVFAPLGGLAAGALGETIGVRATFGVAVILLFAGCVRLAVSPIRSLRGFPESPVDARENEA